MRRFLRWLSPWRYGWTCRACGDVQHGWQKAVPGVPTKRYAKTCCERMSPDVRRELAPWVDRALYLAILLGSLLVFAFFASRADAQQWSGSLQWRGEEISVVSRCGPVSPADVLRELDAGLARVQADLPGVVIPPLGSSSSPYIVLLTVDPPCPKTPAALGCTTDAPFAKLPWTMARLSCNGGLAALDHEALEHTECRRLRPKLRPGKPKVDAKKCLRAGHKLCRGERCNVLGERVAGRRVPKGKQ